MTVSALITRNDITATASQTSFAYTFRVLAATDMDVYQNGVLLSSGYTVNNVGTTTGGTVVLDTGVPVGQIVSLVLAMPLDRTTNYQNSGKFLADDVNEDFDKIYIGAIQNENLNDRSLRLKDVEPPTSGVDMTLPLKADRKGKFLSFNATTGAPEVSAGTGADAYDSAAWSAYNFTGNGSTTAFALGIVPHSENNTQVYIDGVYQQKDGYSLSGSTITFSVAPPNLSTIEVMVTASLAVGSTSSDLVSYLPAGTGAVATTVQTKLRESVSVKDFGAVGDGVTDNTAALKACFDYAIPIAATVVIPSGTYKISGPLQTVTSIGSGGLHIIAGGNVSIEVDSGATAFDTVLYFETTAISSASITGGRLSIDGANLASSGITIRHNGSTGGDINLEAKLNLINFKEVGAAVTRENQALSILGEYISITIEDVYVESVQRTNTSGGATKGVGISGVTGNVTVNNAYIKNVLTPNAASADSDGMAIFGKANGTWGWRAGVATVNNATFIDCQGRSFKGQCSNITLYRPKVFRQFYVSQANGIDYDFQFSGQSLLIEPFYQYKLNGSTSPLGSSFASVAFQQTLDDARNVGKSIGGTLLTEASVPRYCSLIFQATAKESFAEVSGLVIQAIGSFTGNAFSRAIVEFDANLVEDKTEKTKIKVSECVGPIGLYAIGYTGYTTGSLTAKLSFEISDMKNLNTGTLAAFNSLSGNTILGLESFYFKNNNGYKSLMPASFAFNFNNLEAGTIFAVDIATISATNAPSWGSSGYAHIEVLDQWFGANDKSIRVTKDNAATSSTVFFTQGGSTPTWGTIK